MRSTLLSGFAVSRRHGCIRRLARLCSADRRRLRLHTAAATRISPGAAGSEADQSATTLGGTATGRGRVTYQRRQQPQRRRRARQLRRPGHDHRRRRRHRAWTRDSPTAETTTTSPAAFGSSATQSTATVGGAASGNGRSATNGGQNPEPSDRRVLFGRSAGRHPRRHRRPARHEYCHRRTEPQCAPWAPDRRPRNRSLPALSNSIPVTSAPPSTGVDVTTIIEGT